MLRTGAEGNSGPRPEEGAGRWRKLYKEELGNSYPSQNIISLIKPKRRANGTYSTLGKNKKCIYNISRRL
jgi:hypothetical protein